MSATVLEWASPVWLLALSAIPLIRWLHSFQSGDRVRPVAALYLWTTGADELEAGRQKMPPRPVWMLRAAAFSAMVLALSRPYWMGSHSAPVTVWIDASMSMYTDELRYTRLEHGIERLLKLVDEQRLSDVELRLLGDPLSVLQLPSGSGRIGTILDWAEGGQHDNSPPERQILPSNRNHWLVTDGASTKLNDWALRAPLSHVIQVGQETENVAMAALAWRLPEGDEPHRFLLTAVNAGLKPAERELIVERGDEILWQSSIELQPGESWQRLVALDIDSDADIEARLLPHDALAEDDSLTLAAGWNLRHAVGVDDRCNDFLKSAVGALRDVFPTVLGMPGNRLNIVCGAADSAINTPVLSASTVHDARAVDSAPFWLPGAGGLRQLLLDPGWLEYSISSLPGGNYRDLLIAGDVPLIQIDDRREILHINIDLASEQLVRRPEYPLLIAGMMEVMIGKKINAYTDRLERPGDDSRIAPQRSLSLAAYREEYLLDHLSTGYWEEVLLSLGLLLVVLDMFCISSSMRHYRSAWSQED